MKYKSIDLFAGIGGIRLGFDNAFKDEIETVFISEWDEKAQETYKANFNDEIEIAEDITQIDEKAIPEFDICLAGFTCQAFSLAGQRMGFEDNYKGMCRGTLFQDVARICEYHKPKVIFCENVNGTNWRDGNGRPKNSGTKKQFISEWKIKHPDGKKIDCHKETGISRVTIDKWWNE